MIVDDDMVVVLARMGKLGHCAKGVDIHRSVGDQLIQTADKGDECS